MDADRADERGRVTIPKDIREKTGLKPNTHVRIIAKKNAVTIEKTVDLNEFIDRLRGCITVKGGIDPLHLKDIWRTNS